MVEYEPTVVGFNKHIGYFVTKPQNPKEEIFGVQFKLKYTEDGLVVFDDCNLVEEWTEETKIPKKKDAKPAPPAPAPEKKDGEDTKMEAENASQPSPPPQEE